jgi:hypothetical protein
MVCKVVDVKAVGEFEGMRVDDGLGAVKMKFQGRPATTRHLTR